MLKIATELAKKDKDLARIYEELRQKYEGIVKEQKDEELISTYRTLVTKSARTNYEDMASKYFQPFLLIADAMNKVGDNNVDIWDDHDKFYYDILNAPPGKVAGANSSGVLSMKVRFALILFYENFHGDNGAGVGASHQTGWTGVVANLIQDWGEYSAQNKGPKP
ncbi:MAG TPA: hypothetical protein VIQ31_13225 [Phormidium sp.]